MEREEFRIECLKKGLVVLKEKEIPYNTKIGFLKTQKNGEIDKKNPAIYVVYTISSEIPEHEILYGEIFKLLCEKYKLN